MMDDLPKWRPPSYDFVHPDQPDWLRQSQMRGVFREAITDQIRRRAYETLLAVDEQFAAILRVLPESTIVVFTSDNGVGWGEHGLFFQFKKCPYDECVRVPLMIRAPSLKAGESRRLTLNIDVAPIVMGLSGLKIPVAVDGQTAARGRARFEFDETGSGPAPSWTAARTRGHLIVENATGEYELYGVSHDPYQMNPIGVRIRARPE
jgi:arylsulfatase A-like enzyme